MADFNNFILDVLKKNGLSDETYETMCTVCEENDRYMTYALCTACLKGLRGNKWRGKRLEDYPENVRALH